MTLVIPTCVMELPHQLTRVQESAACAASSAMPAAVRHTHTQKKKTTSRRGHHVQSAFGVNLSRPSDQSPYYHQRMACGLLPLPHTRAGPPQSTHVSLRPTTVSSTILRRLVGPVRLVDPQCVDIGIKYSLTTVVGWSGQNKSTTYYGGWLVRSEH